VALSGKEVSVQRNEDAMKNIQDVIRSKEQQLQQIQKELEALKLAAKLLTEDGDAAAPAARPAAATTAPGMVMRPASAAKDSGTYAAAAAWDATKPQFP
jgi:hypothetical protein